MSYLILKNISKSFGNTLVLKQIDFEIKQGEIIAFLGNSGCGKSTLLRILAGFETSDSGSITFEENNILKQPPHKRNIGMFFQNYALFPHLNVEDNIRYGLNSDSTDRVQELIEICNLKGQEKKLIHEISGGQQQRVALARALAPKPHLILLDEPFSNIDGLLKDKLRLELKEMIKKANVSAIFVSHDIDDAFAIANRALILHDGIIQQYDKPENLYRYPNSKFVADFMGNSIILSGELTHNTLTTNNNLIFSIDNHKNLNKKGEFVVRNEDFDLNKDGKLEFTVTNIEFKRTHQKVTLKAKSTDLIITTEVHKNRTVILREAYAIHISNFHSL